MLPTCCTSCVAIALLSWLLSAGKDSSSLCLQGIEANTEAALQVAAAQSGAVHREGPGGHQLAQCHRSAACSKPLGHTGFCDSALKGKSAPAAAPAELVQAVRATSPGDCQQVPCCQGLHVPPPQVHFGEACSAARHAHIAPEKGWPCRLPVMQSVAACPGLQTC